MFAVRVIRAILLLSAVLILTAGEDAVAGTASQQPLPAESPQLCYRNRIEVDPAAPKRQDAVRITTAGQWCDACVPRYQSHARSGGTIRIEAVSDAFNPDVHCLSVLTPWAFTVKVGALPPGAYNVEVYISAQFHYSSTFTVAPGPIFMPLLLNRPHNR